jgi:S-methylmethionine-dependent homocysteine/selenocysteine methylase
MSKPVWFQTRKWLRLLEVPNKTGVEMLNTETIPNLLEIQVWLKIQDYQIKRHGFIRFQILKMIRVRSKQIPILTNTHLDPKWFG